MKHEVATGQPSTRRRRWQSRGRLRSTRRSRTDHRSIPRFDWSMWEGFAGL